MIKQITNENKRVMTDLVCDVDGVRVSYSQIHDAFAYRMQVFHDVPMETAMKAVDQIVSAMEAQSYDHGAEWRRTSIEVVPKTDEYSIYQDFIVHFRMRDSY